MIYKVILQAMYRHGQPCRVEDLAPYVELDNVTLSRTFRDLFDKGLTQRTGTRFRYHYTISALGVDFLFGRVERCIRPRHKGRNPDHKRQTVQFGHTWLAPLSTGIELRQEIALEAERSRQPLHLLCAAGTPGARVPAGSGSEGDQTLPAVCEHCRRALVAS